MTVMQLQSDSFRVPSQGLNFPGAKWVQVTENRDARGALVAFDRGPGLPFELKRVFCIYDVPHMVGRADHAVSSQSMLVALAGSVHVSLDNATQQQTFILTDPALGLFVDAGVLIKLESFHDRAVLMVLSSELYADVEYADQPFFPHARPSASRSPLS